MNWNNGNVNNNDRDNNNNYVRAVAALPQGFPKKKKTKKMSEENYLIPLEDFFNAYFDCRKNKRNSENALEFEVDYESNIVRLWREVNEKRYEIGKSITFVVTKPVKREVFAPTFRDRVVHHLLIGKLLKYFEAVFIDNNFNCRKGKGVLYGVKSLKQQIAECSNNYTEDCWIAKFDMKGFFMSIDKQILWNMLERFIWENYTEPDLDIILYLTKKIVFHAPEENCVRHSPMSAWGDIPSNKSLFTNGDGLGLMIGSLPSQIFANFYLTGFDHLMQDKFGYYGRYVDDFFVIAKDKKDILGFIPNMRSYLWENLRVTLHPDKFNLQHYTKGCNFTGQTVKRDRMYAGNRTISYFYDCMRKWNARVDSGEVQARDVAESFVASVNSYLGYMVHSSSYAIRRKILDSLSSKWFECLYICTGYRKLKLKKGVSKHDRLKKRCRRHKLFKFRTNDNCDKTKKRL